MTTTVATVASTAVPFGATLHAVQWALAMLASAPSGARTRGAGSGTEW